MREKTNDRELPEAWRRFLEAVQKQYGDEQKRTEQTVQTNTEQDRSSS